MSQSVAHIYLSALPFAPSSSIISKLYAPRFPNVIKIEQGRLTHWPPLVMTISLPTRENAAVCCVAFSMNDRYIAAGLSGGTVCVWNASTGMAIGRPFGAEDRTFVSAIAFSHDGQYLASGLSNGRIRIWDLTTMQEFVVRVNGIPFTGHTGHVSALSFSKDGMKLMSGSGDCTVRIWDLNTGEVAVGPLDGHSNPVHAVSFLPDNNHVLSRSGFRAVQVWNMKTGKKAIGPFSFEEMVIPTGTIDSSIYFLDGSVFYRDWSRIKSKFVACSWTTATEREEHYTPPFSKYWAPAFTFSPDGQLVATCTPNYIHIWQASGPSAGTLVSGPFSNDRVMCLAFSADGQRIVSGSKDGIVRVWNVGTVHRHDGVSPSSQREVNPSSVAFFPDGKHIAVGSWDGAIQVLDAINGQEVMKIRDAGLVPKMFVNLVAVSVNGDRIAWVDDDAMNVVWTTPTGGGFIGPLTIRLEGTAVDHISALAFSSDLNDLVVFGTYEGIVCLLDVSIGALVAETKDICDERVACLAVSSSTTGGATAAQIRIAVGFGNGLVFIWDTVADDVAGPFEYHRDSIRALAFSPGDGRYITSVGKDYSVSICDATRGDLVGGAVTVTDDKKIASWRGNASSLCAALTQDGRKVAFVGKDHRILVFEVVHGAGKTVHGISLQAPLVLAGHSNKVTSISFSMDGRFLATTSDDHTIRVWDLQVAAKRKHDIITAIPETLDMVHFTDETFIDNDGWATYTDGRGGPPSRLVWVPEVHRASITRPSNMCVVSRIETRLDLEDLVHGENWVRCKGP